VGEDRPPGRGIDDDDRRPAVLVGAHKRPKSLSHSGLRRLSPL
jgi:hypothetical protein